MKLARTDCQGCGAPRPTSREAGLCSACWTLYLELDRLRGRRATTRWRLRAVPWPGVAIEPAIDWKWWNW